MSDELLENVLAELAEVKRMLTALVADRQADDRRAAHYAELAMVDAMNIDPIDYLKSKDKDRRNAKRQEMQATQKRTGSRNPVKRARKTAPH